MNISINEPGLLLDSSISDLSFPQDDNLVANWPRYFFKVSWFPWHRMTRLLTNDNTGPELDDLKIRYLRLKAESVLNRPNGLALFKSLDTVRVLL
jgi:hypothetical protein